MGTLASELGTHAARIAGQPHVYVDANVPAGLVVFMRMKLRWDVLFVIAHDDLRRARELRRTLITLDRDYLDDSKFPPAESGDVFVLTAPAEKGYMALLKRLDAGPLQKDSLPLQRRKVQVDVDWPGGDTILP